MVLGLTCMVSSSLSGCGFLPGFRGLSLSLLLFPQFGPFTPLLKLTRLVIGEKPLNKLRGKGIALHSQVCLFCGLLFFSSLAGLVENVLYGWLRQRMSFVLLWFGHIGRGGCDLFVF